MYLKFNSTHKNVLYGVAFVIIVLTFILVIVHTSQMQTLVNAINYDGFQDSGGISTSQGEAKVVLFFATWCGHCNKLKPDWDKLKSEMDGTTNSNGNKVTFVEVDCSDGNPLSEKYGVKGFPTIKGFSNGGEPTEHSGDRSLSGIKAYADSL
jgi:thiol-disulfide isomerase/thioredoxin